MTRKLLLMFAVGLCSGYAAFAQDPAVGGIVINPNPMTTGQVSSITASFGNGSSSDIPQASNATYTFNLPPNIGVLPGSAVSVPTGSTNTTANLVLTVGAYSNASGTIVTVRSTNGPVPGNALYDLVIPIVGVSPTGGLPPNVLANAVGSGLASNNTTNDNAQTPVAVTGPLPVALVSFTAKALENRTVDLAWTTSLETNNKGFLIERSKDLKAFERVGEITELGANSSALKNYHLTDFTPYQGTSYYRLTQTDLDGKVTVYQDKVVSVILRDGAYGVFPNPVINDQQFRLSLDEPETALVNFYGADGRLMPIQTMGVESGNLLLKVTGKLSSGVYILTVAERGQTRKHRLVVE